MDVIWEGILLGLTLTILLGPIFIALTQTSIERGGTAGMTVGLGVWTSDFLIIGLCYAFVKRVTETIENDTVQFWMCIGGGFILMAFGIGAFFTKINLEGEKKKLTVKSFSGYWLKGFLVNTVNPFTFIFWISVITSQVIRKSMSNRDALLFFGSIMVTIIVTDCLKVWGAKVLRDRLKSNHLIWFGRVAGIGLFAFGIYLMATGVHDY